MQIEPVPPFVIAIDQSTSATKAIAFDRRARIVARSSVEHRQIYPHPGWVEHDAEELFQNTLRAARAVITELGSLAGETAAVAITNQRETVVVWDKASGRPLYNAVVWQCGRGAPRVRQLRAEGYTPFVKESTGLLLDPYFSASKIEWIVKNVPGAARAAREGSLAFGTVDSWLIWKLTGGAAHVTDHSNASRTMLMNLLRLDWDDALLSLFGLSREMAPKLLSSNDVFGETDFGGSLSQRLPICGVLGDSHGAMYAQQCYAPGLAKVTYGTGSSMMMNVGDRVLDSGQSLVTSVGWTIDGSAVYVFEGNVHSTGDTIKWLVDGIGLLPDPSSSEEVARSVDDNNGVYLVPAFSGLGAPYWDSEARAVICGMSRNTTRAHIVRAAVESIAFQITDLATAMRARSGVALSELRVDGGASCNDFLVQLQADLIEVPVVRMGITEASALGAALMAGTAVGIWTDPIEAASGRRDSQVFRSSMPRDERVRLLEGWHSAVERTLYRPKGARQTSPIDLGGNPGVE